MSKTWEVYIGKDNRLWPKGYGRVEAKGEVFTVSETDPEFELIEELRSNKVIKDMLEKGLFITAHNILVGRLERLNKAINGERENKRELTIEHLPINLYNRPPRK